ncbi:MAG: ECF transporter S component [Nitrososphaerales archaeon]
MTKAHNKRGGFFPEGTMSKTRLIALITMLAALSNVMTLVSMPITMFGVVTRIHFTQLPVLTAALGIGPLAGGLVGLIGATTMAFSVTPLNPFIILYNGLLGFFAGLFYIIFKRRRHHILVAQLAAVVGAYIVQVPFVWTLNTQVIGIPAVVVQAILIKLLFEDVVSTLINHPILYRVNLV